MMMMARQFWKIESLQGILPLGAKGLHQSQVSASGRGLKHAFRVTARAVLSVLFPRCRRLFRVLFTANQASAIPSSPSSSTMSSLNIIRRATSIRSASRLLASTPPRAALARSYATPSEEVDPQLDGYPQLPLIQRGSLPARGWDDMLERRNFGETVSLCSFYQM